MAQVALIVAVENYLDRTINKVEFAEADAREIASALTGHGFTVQNTLLSRTATRATIESQVKRGLARLSADDSFFLYYAGHGFAKNGLNYVTCYDTDPSDLASTSVSLQWVLEQINGSNAKKIALFLDSCESGITAMTKVRGLYSTMNDSELEEFFSEAEYSVCFSACKATEYSHPSTTLKHGIWTHHILQALLGDAPDALEEKRYLTANSLQNYLSREVPRTLRATYSKPAVQTPWRYGSSSRDFLIADLGPILQARSAVRPNDGQVQSVLMRFVENVAIKSLSGFKKTHRVPDSVNNATRNFVESISADEIQQTADAVYSAIKEKLGYKRRDVVAQSGKIVTPDFEYTVYCEQDEDDPGEATITEELTNINPEIVRDGSFNKVFSNRFDELVFSFPHSVDVEKVIDAIEEAEPDGLDLEYPADASECTIRISGSSAVITLSEDSLSISTLGKNSPQELLEAFFSAQKQLAAAGTARYLPIRS